MEVGDLYLKAWGMGIAPQAQLNFGNDRLWTDSYIPLAGLFGKGSKLIGYRCEECQFVAFQYPKNSFPKE
jgi:hypothetical protein